MMKRILILFVILLSSFLSIAQNEEPVNKGDGKREEIQRYFGYEDLTYRYLTLPYDASMNVNQQGKFVDIGFLLIALLPLVFLSLIYKKSKWFYTGSILLILYLFMCFSHSRILTNDKVFEPRYDTWSNFSESDSNLADKILYGIYSIAKTIVSPDFTSENFESLTYPIVIGITLALFSFLIFQCHPRTRLKILVAIFGVYSFLWIILSGGILWYGFLFLPIGFLLIGYLLERQNRLSDRTNKITKYICISAVSIWAMIALTGRISNIDYTALAHEEHYGKSIINGNTTPYAMGLFNSDQTLDMTSPYLSKAMNRMNSDDELIYMIGTSYSFNIKNNVNRIFQDNLLTNYTILSNKYPDKEQLIDVLKASGFGYIVVDLYTPTLDNTPEKSLTKKFENLLLNLFQNPKVSLTATDRIVEFVDSEGNAQKLANVFGRRILSNGSYAIYEIL